MLFESLYFVIRYTGFTCALSSPWIQLCVIYIQLFSGSVKVV